jgi:acetyl-CoA carboxylase biotin carboxyl carrier protein
MSDLDHEPVSSPSGEVPAADGPVGQVAMSPDTASLLGLIDRLGSLLERSDLDEIEVEAGETGIVLRKPAALITVATTSSLNPTGAGMEAAGGTGATAAAGAAEPAPASTTRFVRAPLTGIYYATSSPGSPPYVSVGQNIAVGHVIGLIEAMKLFNEIKSDQAGRVVRIVAESGKLVKAKQPLIEIEP